LRYFLGLLHLERKLSAKKGMLTELGQRLDSVQHLSLDDPDLANPDLIRELSGVYKATLSTLPFRIQVTGEANFLKNEELADKIRAVLLAGVRSAVLWYQSEGRRWHLLLGRKKIERNLLLLMNKVHEIH